MVHKLATSHRILRRLAGRMRMDALQIEEKKIVIRPPMIATELEDLADETEPVNRRRRVPIPGFQRYHKGKFTPLAFNQLV